MDSHRENEDEDARHRREEAERRAKRKASKGSRSESQLEKDRKRKEHLSKYVGTGASGADGSPQPPSSKRHKSDTSKGSSATTAAAATTSSAFQELFAQRAQGFQIDFRFRNAPPRPPVGPCFVGHSLNGMLQELSRQYKAHNAVERNHTWKLHTEPDIGVPLALYALNRKSYEKPSENAAVVSPLLHPDDEALINWTGSMGDTAAENLKRRQEQARVAARLALSGRSSADDGTLKQNPAGHVEKVQKKVFSRMLKEDMQTWMKKTTYLSNDYSKRVHDFKSLAQTKSELATELQTKQDEMAIRRSVKSISDSFVFSSDKPLVNPNNPKLQARRVMPLLPDVNNWGRAFTHVVIDKAPTAMPKEHAVAELGQHAFVTNVEKRQANARMTCSLIVPAKELRDSSNDNEVVDATDYYRPVQSFDLDVIPLKEEDVPHVNFCLWLDGDNNVARYIPVASRVQLSVGRPSKVIAAHKVLRRELTFQERTDMEERMAEVDQDMAEKHHVKNPSKKVRVAAPASRLSSSTETAKAASATGGGGGSANAKEDDGEDDFGDDDSDDEEEVFGSGRKTIVAES